MALHDPIDTNTLEFGDLFDELPLWSAPFGLWILDRVPLATDLCVLDLGAGTGFLSIELAERCGPSCKVIAVDPWIAAVARLQRKIEQRGLNNIQLLQQDAATIELPDQSVDVIVSNLGVNNFECPEAVMAVCSKIAKPGASFLLTTNLVGHMDEFYNAYRVVLRQFGGVGLLEKLEAHIQHRATVDKVRQLLANAGFGLQEVVEDSFRLRFANGSAFLRHFFIRFGFLPAWVELVESHSVEEVFGQLEDAINQLAADKGEFSVTIPMGGFIAVKSAER